MIHVIITEVSWKVTMIAGVHVWATVIVSKESLLLGPPTHSAFCSLDPKTELFIALRSSLDYLGSWPSPRPNIWLGPLSLQLFYILYTPKKKKNYIWPPKYKFLVPPLLLSTCVELMWFILFLIVYVIGSSVIFFLLVIAFLLSTLPSYSIDLYRVLEVMFLLSTIPYLINTRSMASIQFIFIISQ